MKVHWIALLIIIGAAFFVPTVSAKIIEDRDGYVVSTVDNITKLDQFARLSSQISNTISQGQLQSYSRSVSSGTTSIISDLNWGSSTDSLSLTLVAPDTTFGPYYDNIDGKTDGRIYIRILKTSGVTSGTWWNRIYGSRVAGSRQYTFESF